MAFGTDGSRYRENKRAVENKYIGPLVKTVMTRCIHCTRCVRFTTEVAGISELGLIGRGEDAEITTYLERAMTSELQGNVIDLCPVGALTSRPYAFQARPWELNKTETIDVMDAVGSNIRVDTRGREVMRVMPRVNEAVNEEWISDKTRFIWDGLRTQRLDRPYVRKDGRLVAASWPEAFSAIAAKVSAMSAEKIGAVAGDLASVEEIYALKGLMASLGTANIDSRQDGAALDPALGRATYLFNSTIEGIENADALLIIGSNPRVEAAVLNARIRKRQRMGHFPVALIGEQVELRYEYEYLGAGAETLAAVAAGKNAFRDVLAKAERPLIIIGQGALTGENGAAVLSTAAKLAQDVGAIKDEWNGFSVLHTAASRVGALDLGFVPGEGGKVAGDMLGNLDVVFLLGADELDMTKRVRASSFTSARTAMPAHMLPTLSCRAPPTRKSRAPGSTPKVACSLAAAPVSHRARQRKTGQSCALFPTALASACRSIRCSSFAPSSMRTIRICWPSTPSRLLPPTISSRWQRKHPTWAAALRSSLRSRTST